MAGRSQESPAHESSPECVRFPEIEREIEDPQLPRSVCDAVNGSPSPRNEVKDREQTHQRSAHVNESLHHIGPDHRRQTAFERIDQRQYSYDRNGRNLPGTQRNRDYNRHGIYTNAFRSASRQQKHARRQRSQPPAKPALNQRISGIQFPAKVSRQQNQTNDDAPDKISEYDLQKSQVGIVSKAGNADDRERAGLRGDNRKRDCPPGNVAIG